MPEAVVSMPKGDSDKEADLLHKIKTMFPTEKRRRYNKLYAKFKDDKIADGERAELIDLVEEFENLNVKRLEYVADIANIRSQPFAEVFKDLGLKPQK